jgi:CxxC-x17-CxxC domain-containing protein
MIKLNIKWNVGDATFSTSLDLEMDAFQAIEYSGHLADAIKAVTSGYDTGLAEMAKSVDKHSAICDNCHKKDYVTFLPKSGKPFLCNACYNKKRSV